MAYVNVLAGESSGGGTEVAARASAAVSAAAQAAREVDVEARFPHEAMGALGDEGLLTAPVSTRNGGGGATLREVVGLTRKLGRACGSTGLIYAMHAGQVICLDRHSAAPSGEVAPKLEELVARVVSEQLVVASSTTEIGTGGDVTRSSCHVEHSGGQIHLEKNAPVISYAEAADIIMVTARRDADAPASDQVLVAVPAAGLSLERTRGWDATGYRGTCSCGYQLVADTSAEYVLPWSYSDISTRTMLPVTHLLWSAAWLGVADSARDAARIEVLNRARAAQGSEGLGPLRLAELTTVWQRLVSLVDNGVDLVENAFANPEEAGRPAFTIAVNSLKIAASELVSQIAVEAQRLVGIEAYRRDSPASLDRVVRDALGASLMVNNDRILGNNARLALMDRGGQ